MTAICLLMHARVSGAAAEAPVPTIAWKTAWSGQVFAEARAQHRFVLLDLEAVWCHWCHVMDQQTYSDPRVTTLVAGHFLAVKVDQDSDPALSDRYGDWGWPATIVLAADGSEIVKRRGFLQPEQMAAMLQAIIDDPTPGPSVVPEVAVVPTAADQLGTEQRAKLTAQVDRNYDAVNGGWGSGYKLLDALAMELAIDRAALGNKMAGQMARQTLDSNLKLLDPLWGGVFQYSDEADWSSPHFEKIVSFQADDLRLYSLAYARWQDPRYLQAAQAIRRYLAAFLTSPQGAYFVSQDADLNPHLTGHDYYRLGDAQRRLLGLPAVDRHLYARENGWVIAALSRYSDLSGDQEARQAAERAAKWVLGHRSLPGGGFRHDVHDHGGPYLGDTLAMAEAFVCLYRSTGDRAWLEHARMALNFIGSRFRDASGGFDTAAADGAAGVFARPVRVYEENVAATRLANLLYRYSGDAGALALAGHGMHYLVAPALIDSGRSLPGVLLADAELADDPVHITIVGAKRDPAAQALHAAALRYPAAYVRVDWWDKSEGPPTNADVQYPALAHAAAFACTGHACSKPVFEPTEIARAVDRVR